MRSPVLTPRSTLVRIILGVMALDLLTACSLRELREQTAIAEGIGRINGRVMLKTGKTGPIRAVMFKPGSISAEYIIVGDVVTDPSGAFRMSAVPGEYFFGAFQDVNGDGVHQRDTEPASYFNSDGLVPAAFTLPPSGQLNLPPLPLTGVFKGVPEVRTVDGSLAVTRNIGRIVSLGDPMFSDANSSLGLWRPVDFLKDVGGGLFMLQDYRPDAIPVIFIHGINGSPDNFKPLIQVLDRSRYQPWVLHYPSGLRLDLVSDYLDRAVVMLQSRYGFRKVFVVAHSMGGLVARSFVMKHEQRNQAATVDFLMTINSPMLGMSSAAKGVEYSPVVVPAWRDVALNSDFVGQVQDWKWPARIPYHLVFSYQPGEGGDGVVPLESQIPIGLQDEAVRVYGFQATHAGILGDQEFLRHFSSVVSKAGPAVASNAL